MPNNKINFLLLIFSILITYGCASTKDVTVKGYIQDKKRVDQEVGGTLGNWKNAPQLVDVDRKDTRKIVVVEVTQENPKYSQQEMDSLIDTEVTNRKRRTSVDDYPMETSSPTTKTTTRSKFVQQELNLPSFDDEPSFDFDSESKMKSTSPQKMVDYTVAKDDTLQKISKKFYGSFSKWSKIYEANKSVIKNPDRISPGTKLKIPMDQ